MILDIFKAGLVYIVLSQAILFAESTLIRANGNEPDTLYPAGDESALANNIRRDLFEPLMSRDAEGNIILGQAKSYRLDETKTIYTFTLRDDAKWSDGTPVTAYDFEYAYQYIANPKNHNLYAKNLVMLNILNSQAVTRGKKPLEELGAKALNDKILKITLEKPTYYLLEGLAHVSMSPIPKQMIEKGDTPWISSKNLLSNGAYMLQSWERGKETILKKNPYYYNVAKVQIESIKYLPINKESLAFRMYKSGKIDYLDEIPKNRYKELQNRYPDELKNAPLLGTFYLGFNLKIPPFDQLKVRKALSYAINRERLANNAMGTGEKPLYTFVPEGIKDYNSIAPKYQQWTQVQRESKAKILLDKVGFSAKNPLRFELLYNANEQNKRVLLAVTGMWKKVFAGQIFIKLKALPWNKYQQEKQNYGVVRLGWVADINDAFNMLEIFTQNHHYNVPSYKNKMFDKRLKQAKQTEKKEDREKIYQELELMINQDVPVAALFQFSTARLIKPYVKGYKSTPLDTVFSKYLSIEKKPND